jgi:hypothetical protein
VWFRDVGSLSIRTVQARPGSQKALWLTFCKTCTSTVIVFVRGSMDFVMADEEHFGAIPEQGDALAQVLGEGMQRFMKVVAGTDYLDLIGREVVLVWHRLCNQDITQTARMTSMCTRSK